MNSIFGEFAAPRDNKLPRQGNDPLVALVEAVQKKQDEQKKQEEKEKE
ncbi:hypothetical protein CPT_Marzo_114 [Stenotrophomonas phage Marzo]|nr:hypothetical protein CPT_Marzo_114 [Stenotrophomonas phage Marzo]